MPMPIEVQVIYNDLKSENYYIPLSIMRGEKYNSNDNIILLKDWEWVNESYQIDLDIEEKKINKIVLDPYTNVPNYRVGLFVKEEIVQAKDDDSLFDNARGFSNFAAPGADRLRISTTLTKKPLNDYSDKNFISC